jgi:beta-glucosidase
MLIGLGILLILGVIFFAWRWHSLNSVPVISGDAVYLNPELPDEVRISDLLSRMTVREKIGQMALVEKNSLIKPEDLVDYNIGALLSSAGSKPATNTSEGWTELVDGYKAEALKTRLHIPILYGVDAVHGHGNLPGATIFPHDLALGATNDPKLVNAIAKATAEEVTATGINWSYSPNLDIPTDIRWGRVYEAFSDNPDIVASLGSAYVSGLQQKTDSALNSRVAILATAKHYIGAGSMLWNTSSNKNYHIDQGTAPIDENALRNIYLPPFKSAIDAGALSVMVGLQSWGNTKLSAEYHLITDVLKHDLGFSGFVVSDWYSVYEIPGGDFVAAIRGINAGVDMVMLPFDYKSFVRNVSVAYSLGFISSDRIDDANRRILRAKFAARLFDANNMATTSQTAVGSVEHRALARKAVAESLVLLKNENILPLKKDHQRILVAGSSADNIGRQSGAWTFEWQGIDGNWLPGATSILSGIKSVVGPSTKILYNATATFATSTTLADVGIAVVGEAPYAEGWGDNASPRLSDDDIATINKLKTLAKKVVVVLVSGRPLIITDQIKDWDALVVAWLPGSEGAGVADGLFGSTPFTGTLPISWPASLAQLPVKFPGKTADGTELLFKQGYSFKN